MSENATRYKTIMKERLAWISFCVVIFFAAVWSVKNPAYNWDMLPYMGIVISGDTPEKGMLHDKVYATAKAELPAMYYDRLVDLSNPYRRHAAMEADFFYAQFPFYIVKPLYTNLAHVFYKAGARLTTATVWPSSMAYVLMGMLLLRWLKHYWSTLLAVVVATLIMICPPFLNLARLSTPDALSALLISLAVYCLIEKKSMLSTIILQVLAITARLDNIIPALFFLPVIWYAGNKGLRNKSMVFLGFFMVLGCFIVVSSRTSNFGWSIYYYPGFVKQLNTSYTANVTFKWNEYIDLVKSQLSAGLRYSMVSLFLLLESFMLKDRPGGKMPVEQVLAIVFLAIIVIRFMLQPLVADRIYAPYYLCIIPLLVRKYALNRPIFKTAFV